MGLVLRTNLNVSNFLKILQQLRKNRYTSPCLLMASLPLKNGLKKVCPLKCSKRTSMEGNLKFPMIIISRLMIE